MLQRPKACALFILVAMTVSLTGLTQPIQIQFVDQDNQPGEFAGVADTRVPVKPISTSKKASQDSAVMDQIDMQFSPMVIAITQGQQVRFPNSDNIRHHVYSFSKAKRFETKLYANQPEAPVLFDEPGIVVLGCNIHDSMIGYIFVSAWQHYGTSDKQGMVNLNNPVTPKTLAYWHPWSLTPNQVNTIEVKQWPTDGPFVISLILNPPKPTPAIKTFKRRYGS
jgi:plastocyanin